MYTLARSIAANTDTFSGPWSGNGVVTLNLAGGEVLSFTGDINQFSGFTGTLSLGTAGTVRIAGRDASNNPLDHGFNNAVVNAGGASLTFADGGTQTLGVLLGGTMAVISGTTQAGTATPATTLVVGGNNLDSNFLGSIRNGLTGTASSFTSLTKIGSGAS